jgi:hypothetical protein
MSESDLIQEAIRFVSESFAADEAYRRRIARMISKYPDTSPKETWDITPILFVTGVLEVPVLRAMPYEEFLQTPYWKGVSWHAKAMMPWCALCCEAITGPLEVHHRTYAHRGAEWQHLEDLTVLCPNCHEWTTKKKVARG